jgi:hypothetical protein
MGTGRWKRSDRDAGQSSVQQLRPIEQDWKRTGLWLVLASVVAAVALHRRPIADTLVAAPLVAAAAVALWVGHTYLNRTLEERFLAGRIIAWCVSAGALAAIVVVIQGTG